MSNNVTAVPCFPDSRCWIAWQHVWLFIGPAIGLCIVTLLVLVFTAKEHYESSYSKNEKTNNMILIHSKALWTQTILLTLCWSFAFISVTMHDAIVKLLYALFNILQGAFFLVFYFLLNDEVRALYRAILKKHNLTTEDMEYPLTSIGEDSDEAVEVEMDSPRASCSVGKNRASSERVNGRKRLKSEIEASSEDDDVFETGERLRTSRV
ncbi:hypothetical protein LSAT2_012517 [Lamellibrachia satsuma]|nr:hypothetical protein LSAT2_012517 [Lamellibrachia satsuma]